MGFKISASHLPLRPLTLAVFHVKVYLKDFTCFCISVSKRYGFFYKKEQFSRFQPEVYSYSSLSSSMLLDKCVYSILFKCSFNKQVEPKPSSCSFLNHKLITDFTVSTAALRLEQ